MSIDRINHLLRVKKCKVQTWDTTSITRVHGIIKPNKSTNTRECVQGTCSAYDFRFYMLDTAVTHNWIFHLGPHSSLQFRPQRTRMKPFPTSGAKQESSTRVSLVGW